MIVKLQLNRLLTDKIIWNFQLMLLSESIKKPNRKTDEYVNKRCYLESHGHDGVHGVDVEEGQNGDGHFLRCVRLIRAEHCNPCKKIRLNVIYNS